MLYNYSYMSVGEHTDSKPMIMEKEGDGDAKLQVYAVQCSRSWIATRSRSGGTPHHIKIRSKAC